MSNITYTDADSLLALYSCWVMRSKDVNALSLHMEALEEYGFIIVDDMSLSSGSGLTAARIPEGYYWFSAIIKKRNLSKEMYEKLLEWDREHE